VAVVGGYEQGGGFIYLSHDSGATWNASAVFQCVLLCPVAVCCSVLQCVAVCCSVLQCVAVCCNVLQCIAVYCSVLQCAAVCCSVLQCVAVCCSVLQCIAVYCSVLPCIAMCCSVLQCAAVCCSVLQSVSECCSHTYCFRGFSLCHQFNESPAYHEPHAGVCVYIVYMYMYVCRYVGHGISTGSVSHVCHMYLRKRAL